MTPSLKRSEIPAGSMVYQAQVCPDVVPPVFRVIAFQVDADGAWMVYDIVEGSTLADVVECIYVKGAPAYTRLPREETPMGSLEEDFEKSHETLYVETGELTLTEALKATMTPLD